MKPLMLFLLIVWSSSTLFAQDDSIASNEFRDTAELSQSPVPGEQSPMLDENFEFTEENSIRLQREHLPPSLIKALDDPEYQGWENGTVMRNILTGYYRIEVVSDDESKVYYFDRTGEILGEE